ncbi:uncharacterized protein LOC144141686 [Haemaphysalis longicornis]
MVDSLFGYMEAFLMVRASFEDTIRNLTFAAVRIGICTLFCVTADEGKTSGSDRGEKRLRIQASPPSSYAFGLPNEDRIFVTVDNQLRYLWRDKASDFTLGDIVRLALNLSRIPASNDTENVARLEEHRLASGRFKVGELVVNSVPSGVNLHTNVRAIVVGGRAISRAYETLASADEETANMYMLVLFFTKYQTLVIGAGKKFQEALSCTLAASKLFPITYGRAEALLFYDRNAAAELRRSFDAAKVTTAEKLGIKGTVEASISVLEAAQFKPDREEQSNVTLSTWYANNTLIGLFGTMEAMLRRIAEGKYGGEDLSHVEAQLNGMLDYDERVASVLVATQHLKQPVYCSSNSTTHLGAGQGGSAPSGATAKLREELTVRCDGGKFRPFLNYGLAVSAIVEGVISAIFHSDKLDEQRKRILEDQASCFQRQLNWSIPVPVSKLTFLRSGRALGIALDMLRAANMALFRRLPTPERNAALQLFFRRYCLRLCGEPGTKKYPFGGAGRCWLGVMNTREFFEAFGCAAHSPMRPREKCAVQPGSHE